MTSTGPSASRRATADTVVVLAIGPIFLLLAAWFLWGVEPGSPPIRRTAAVNRAEIAPAFPRAPMADPPTMIVAGFDKKCIECHSLFSSDPNTPLRLNHHRNLVQAHGMNDRCFNCHDRRDRSRLMLPGGETIPFGETSRLCATCHGTTYRDWQLGMHGRTTGSWDADRGRLRLTCSECHDPHAPAFGPMSPLPGPDTLRMHGPVGSERGHGGAGRRNPLRQWSGGAMPSARKDDH